MYQHYVYNLVNDIDDYPVSMNVKIKGLPCIWKEFIENTIRNFDINLNPMFLSYICCVPTGCAAKVINGTTHILLFNIPTG